MKRIFDFTQFIKEALRDEIPDHQKDTLRDNVFKYDPDDDEYFNDVNVDHVLDADIPKKSENIKEGVWKLSVEDKNKAIQIMFNVNVPSIDAELSKFTPSENFLKVLKMSIIPDIDIDIKQPSIKEIKILFENNFRMLNNTETKSNKKVKRNEAGHPLRGEDGEIIYEDKEEGEPVFTENKSNINNLIMGYFNCYPNDIFYNPFAREPLKIVYSRAAEVVRLNFDIDILGKFDLELYISGKPEDILNMSLSAFYDSCQNIYDGGYRHKLPANIFDKNCKIAFLRFNTPFTDKMGNVIPFTPFSRCLIRDIKGQIYFESAYPKMDRGVMGKFHHAIIEKYTGMKSTYNGVTYYYNKNNLGLASPYLDTLGLDEVETANDAKSAVLHKIFKIDEDYIYRHNMCEYYSVDENEDRRDFYIFDTKYDSDMTRLYSNMINKLNSKFASLYDYDEWANYIDFDRYKKENEQKCRNIANDKGIDYEKFGVEDMIKYIMGVSPDRESRMFAQYARKFFDKILLDWKNQAFKVLGGFGKEILDDKYLIIEKP